MMLRMIGGEMLLWSDLDGTHGSGPVRGRVLEPLVASATGRTLIAGPHDPALIDVASDEDLTVLVRGLPDAELLAARYAGRPGVTVWCGSPEKLAAEAPFDTVIALDGLERLCSVEGAAVTWADTFETLCRALRPGGRLLLAVENAIGVHRLVALRDEVTDTHWAGSFAHDATRPAGWAAIRDQLDGAGLELDHAYACYPSPGAPSVLLGARILADGAVHGFLAATLGEACTPARNVLSDPAALAVSALRHGVGAELAPARILLCHRPASATDTPAVSGVDGSPDAMVATGPVRYDIRRGDDGRWIRRPGGASETDVLPAGRTLQELLLGACLRADLPAVRDLLVAWQGDPAAGVGADRVIVGPDGGLTALAPAGDPAVALRAFAALLHGGGHPHPWPGAADDVDLAMTVAALAGREPDPMMAVGTAPSRPDDRAFRELSASRDRLVEELAQAKAREQWYERTLTEREDALRHTRRTVELLGDTGPARLGRALVGGIRVARRTARASVRRLISRS